jgi:SAM-dependent methyltransferase
MTVPPRTNTSQFYRPVIQAGGHDEQAAMNDDVIGVANRMIAAVDTASALAIALGARARGETLPDQLGQIIDSIAAAVVDLDAVPSPLAGSLGSLLSSMIAQDAAFVANPVGATRWQFDDPMVLRTQGRASAAFAPLLRDQVVSRNEVLAARLAAGGGILDVGVGVAALATELARVFPGARVTGIDVREPSLALARGEIAAAGLDDRVDVKLQDVAALDDVEHYDLVWFAAPFIPDAVFDAGLRRCRAATRDGGVIAMVCYGGTDALTSALADLRTLRSGGPVLSDDAAIERVHRAGYAHTELLRVDIGLPARLFVGQAI